MEKKKVNEETRAKARIQCGVFEERRADGRLRLHAVVLSETETQGWHYFENILRGDFRVACHVRVGSGSGTCHATKMLKYTMVPTSKKLKLDKKPFFSEGFTIPQKIIEMRSKAYSTLAGKPADHDEVYEWIRANPEINSYDQFQDFVDRNRETRPDDIELIRLSKFLSRNVKDGRKTVSHFVERRNRQKYRDLAGKNWDFFLEEAWKSICVCSTPLQLASDNLQIVKWHDASERLCKDSEKTIGDYAKYLYLDAFPDRRENIFGIGKKGTGKSTILCAFEHIVPDHLIFTPVLGSGAPFAMLRDHHILGNFQEFRCAPNVNCSTVLLLMERKKDLMVDVKHDDPIHLPNGGPRCVLSGNYLSKCVGWKDEDIEALYDRGMTFWRNRELPQGNRNQNSKKKCKKCAITFLAWCSPELKNALENKLGPLPMPLPCFRDA